MEPLNTSSQSQPHKAGSLKELRNELAEFVEELESLNAILEYLIDGTHYEFSGHHVYVLQRIIKDTEGSIEDIKHELKELGG